MDLPHLKLGKSGNAKYRRRVTSPAMRAMLGKSAVEWSLRTRDPLKIVKAWEEAHARFEALEAKAGSKTTAQAAWDVTLEAAVAYGLATADAARIGPVDAEREQGRFKAFTDAIITEAGKLSPQQRNAKFGTEPPVNAALQLVKAKMRGVERPPVRLSEAVRVYLRDREARSTYPDLEKQVGLVVSGIEGVMGEADPVLTTIDRDTAYAYRDSLLAKGNSLGTVQRRITSIKAVLNAAGKRFDLRDWRNPFNAMGALEDDAEAGEEKRLSLTLTDLRLIRDCQTGMNEDARDIWHLMMFTGLGPNEARGLQWGEVFLDDQTPHIQVKANHRRRLKKKQRRRRVPLVGSVLAMMRRKRRSASDAQSDVFPRYGGHRNANTLSASLVKPMKAAGVWRRIVKVPYSLRHTLKDALRRTCPQPMQLLLLGHGHSEGQAASQYGMDDLLDQQAHYLTEAITQGGWINYPELPGIKAWRDFGRNP